MFLTLNLDALLVSMMAGEYVTRDLPTSRPAGSTSIPINSASMATISSREASQDSKGQKWNR